MNHKIKNRLTAIKCVESGITHTTFLITLALVFVLFSFFRLNSHSVTADSPRINSGFRNYCLNLQGNVSTPDSAVNIEKCDSTRSQVWSVSSSTITYNSSYCLSVAGSATKTDSKVTLDSCNNSPGQVWLREQNGYYNPNSTLCLSASEDVNVNLSLGTCGQLSGQPEEWLPIDQSWNINSACTGSEGDKVACNAEKEWANWQSTGSNHETLLNNYTDGAPYEEWCADFVSYVYKESGYPFTNGNSNGWDENIANNIQYMGFTVHSANSGYIPKPGDVAFFDYSGGHVEIVISGGTRPSFIYGNSATIDPTTGNGEMASNTITNKGPVGQLEYYLSPS